ncbi:MAG: oxidoreductase, partial [Pseudomonadota bacterium]
MLRTGQLRADVVLEPLWNQWYAWSYLIPPACAARYVAHSHLPVMQSFVDAPQVHVDALRDPAMIGGPFIQYGIERAQEVAALLERTRRDQRHLLALDNAITALEAALEAHPRGASLEPLYAELPPALGGMVELVYDARDRPSIRFIEALFYRSDFYRSTAQSIALRRVPDVDQRAFVMSTPRLEADLECHLPLSFADPRLDDLCRLRTRSGNIGELAEALELNRTQREAFAALFVEGRDAEPSRPHGNEVRVRYLGHACVLVESADVAVLVDPL